MSHRPPLAVCCTRWTEGAMPDGAQRSCAAAGSQCCDAPGLAAPHPTSADGCAGRPWRGAGRDLRGNAPPSPHQFLLLPQRSRGVRHLSFFKHILRANALITPSSFKPEGRLVSQQLTSHPQFKNSARLEHVASMQSA